MAVSMSHRTGHSSRPQDLRLVCNRLRVCCAVVAWLCLASSALAARPAAQPPSPKWSTLDQAVGKENYVEAKKLADAILQRGTPEDRVRASKVYGRILLALGQKELAKQYLTMLAKSDSTGGQLTAIYTAWFKAIDGKPDEGIKVLEKLLADDKTPAEITAEAADVLAMLYMARGDQEKAKKTVDQGMRALQYLGAKDGYLLALLRGRLSSNIVSGEAKRLHDAAEKLRAQRKFPEAVQVFAQVRAMYPKSEWANASGFRIGQCYVGMERPSQAIDWWQKFIKESPAGPWRGQAHVALVDAVLGSQLDLKKATEFTMTATAVLAKGLGKEAESSWKEASYGIYLRQGIISLVDGRFDAAAQAFQQAKQVGGGSSNPALLDRLIDAAKRRAKLIPDELGVGDDRAVVALALGNIYSILHQYDTAKGYFSLPLSGPMRSRSAAHRSFAGLGFARILVATGDGPTHNVQVATVSPKAGAKAAATPASPFLPAVIAYQASIKEYPNGSWHDETLRELALLTERIAAEQFEPRNTQGVPISKGADKKLVAPPPMTDAARQQQKKAVIAARIRALPYWLELRQRYPTSRYVPQALYHVGLLYADAGKPDEALVAFDELIKKYPDSAWTGDAQVWLIDVKLEHQFDLPGASSLAEAAVDWYEHLDKAKAAQARKGLGDDQSDALRSLQQVGYDIYVRAGLVEYLNESGKGAGVTSDSTSRFTRAVAIFEKAKPFQLARDFVVVQGHIPTGIERLIEITKAGKSLTPEVVRHGDEKARTILMLADVYHEGQQYQKSLDLCSRVIEGVAPKATREQKSYACFRRARNHFLIFGKAFNPDAALTDYVAAVAAAPRTEWADSAMFFAGNIEWNHKHNLEAALAVWHRLIRDYPQSSEADRCAFYIGLAHYFSKQYPQAQKALGHYLANYPSSEFIEDARRILDKCNVKVNEPQKREGR